MEPKEQSVIPDPMVKLEVWEKKVLQETPVNQEKPDQKEKLVDKVYQVFPVPQDHEENVDQQDLLE